MYYLIWRSLQPHSYQRRWTNQIITPGTPVLTNTFSTPQRSIQPGYTLQVAAGDQSAIIALYPFFFFGGGGVYIGVDREL